MIQNTEADINKKTPSVSDNRTVTNKCRRNSPNAWRKTSQTKSTKNCLSRFILAKSRLSIHSLSERVYVNPTNTMWELQCDYTSCIHITANYLRSQPICRSSLYLRDTAGCWFSFCSCLKALLGSNRRGTWLDLSCSRFLFCFPTSALSLVTSCENKQETHLCSTA